MTEEHPSPESEQPTDDWSAVQEDPASPGEEAVPSPEEVPLDAPGPVVPVAPESTEPIEPGPEAAGEDGATSPGPAAPDPEAAGIGAHPGSLDNSGDAAEASVFSQPSERPEVPIGAAFAGGLVAALILKRLAR